MNVRSQMLQTRAEYVAGFCLKRIRCGEDESAYDLAMVIVLAARGDRRSVQVDQSHRIA